MKWIKKNWFILIVIFFCFIRFLLSCKLSSYFINILTYDDSLMLKQFSSLLTGHYLGGYCGTTLIKGMIFPFFLYLSRVLKMSYSVSLTIFHIGGCLFLGRSLSKIIKNKILLLISFVLILFNPVSYSSELFQRMYVNSICIIELLFFLGVLINIILEKKLNIINYLFLGFIITIMFLTRNDSIWIFVILFIVFILKLIKDFNIKRLIFIITPILIFVININTVRFINYKYYGLYTYNELTDSNFKKAYSKLLQIKDEERIDNVAIPKSTLYKVASLTDALGIDKNDIDTYYKKVNPPNGEFDNGDIVWLLRDMIFYKNRFENAYEANQFYGRLSDELDRLFKEGKLEKEFSLPLVFINTPSLSELKRLPKNILKAIWYTTSYQNVRTYDTYTIKHINSNYESIYLDKYEIYSVYYRDYRHAENMSKNNILGLEIIRIIYKYLTILLSILSLVIFIKNIKTIDTLNYIIIIIVLSYLIILFGVVYTHTTAFFAIRYRYLSNIYILQNLFIILNIYRLFTKKIDSK